MPRAKPFKFGVKFFQNRVETGLDDRGVPFHKIKNALRVLEKSDMTHLIEFIRTDELI